MAEDFDRCAFCHRYCSDDNDLRRNIKGQLWDGICPEGRRAYFNRYSNDEVPVLAANIRKKLATITPPEYMLTPECPEEESNKWGLRIELTDLLSYLRDEAKERGLSWDDGK